MSGTPRGWIGVDLDGTLAFYEGWNPSIGAPIAEMVDRVKAWRSEGIEVRIMTARASSDCASEIRRRLIAEVEAWCLEHVGEVLPVTAEKDFRMIELWDDRAIQVMPNTGQPIPGFMSRVGCPHHESIMAAVEHERGGGA